MKVTIYGASDDLIEIDGDFRYEFSADEEVNYLALSDGTLLSIEYAKGGIWRINRLVTGSATYSKVEGTDAEDDYTDKVTIEGDLKWFVLGSEFARK
jgi:hypothetical protein